MEQAKPMSEAQVNHRLAELNDLRYQRRLATAKRNKRFKVKDYSYKIADKREPVNHKKPKKAIKEWYMYQFEGEL